MRSWRESTATGVPSPVTSHPSSIRVLRWVGRSSDILHGNLVSCGSGKSDSCFPNRSLGRSRLPVADNSTFSLLMLLAPGRRAASLLESRSHPSLSLHPTEVRSFGGFFPRYASL